tara:strand:- start:977 stop:1156 length:180 start_codon:yes stop_codon:yes gene_type:complete
MVRKSFRGQIPTQLPHRTYTSVFDVEAMNKKYLRKHESPELLDVRDNHTNWVESFLGLF